MGQIASVPVVEGEAGEPPGEIPGDQAAMHLVEADDKRRARLNCISHLLDQIPYERTKKRRVVRFTAGKALKGERGALVG
mgnify:CR=1 FL=1